MTLSQCVIHKCENGAWHSNMCCTTCWNHHTLAQPGDSFLHSPIRKQLLDEEWMNNFMDRATDHGFTKFQAQWMANNKDLVVSDQVTAMHALGRVMGQIDNAQYVDFVNGVTYVRIPKQDMLNILAAVSAFIGNSDITPLYKSGGIGA